MFKALKSLRSCGETLCSVRLTAGLSPRHRSHSASMPLMPARSVIALSAGLRELFRNVPIRDLAAGRISLDVQSSFPTAPC
jgi:hypothetical protein